MDWDSVRFLNRNVDPGTCLSWQNQWAWLTDTQKVLFYQIIADNAPIKYCMLNYTSIQKDEVSISKYIYFS